MFCAKMAYFCGIHGFLGHFAPKYTTSATWNVPTILLIYSIQKGEISYACNNKKKAQYDTNVEYAVRLNEGVQ